MCARIVVIDVGPAGVWWDADQQAIYIRRGAGISFIRGEISAILRDLGGGVIAGVAVCWCSEPVPEPETRLRTREPVLYMYESTGVMRRGA